MKPRIYLDLDGVMADFDRHYGDRFDTYHDAIPDDELWGKINSSPDFFRTMPAFPDARRFFDNVVNLLFWGSHTPLHASNVTASLAILTACPKSNYAHVANQKRGWVREHLADWVTVLPAAGGTSKPLFMHAPGDILVDDFERNTTAWETAGGRAILHKGDLRASFEALEAMVLQ